MRASGLPGSWRPPGSKSADGRGLGLAGSFLRPNMERSAQQAITNVFIQVHKFFLTEPGALTLPLGEVPFRSGPTSPGNAPASCRAGTWGWRRADRGRRRAGTQGCHGAFSRRRLPPGRGTTLPREATQRRDPAAAASGPAIRRSRASERVPRQALRRRRATHPVQVEALGAARGLLGAGAQAHGHGQLGRQCPGTATPTREAQPAAPSADSPSRRSTTRALSRGRMATPTPNSDALREQPAAPFPRTRRPPTSGRERRTQDPDLRI